MVLIRQPVGALTNVQRKWLIEYLNGRRSVTSCGPQDNQTASRCRAVGSDP